MRIPIGSVGSITNSGRPGHAVCVADDSENTGGFIVHEWWAGSTGPNKNGAFDSWVENLESLSQFFIESEWQIVWA